jgi:hypothetical protein
MPVDMASMKDIRNRARWSRDQKHKSDAAFAASRPSVEQERAEKLVGLRAMEQLMVGIPHMTETLAQVRAEIIRLESAS